ncbi:MAG: type II toxin-antitoxin system VapC family toxin [Terriglobia bacterium]
MAQFVLDACVAISWCFPGDPTEDTPYSRAILKRLVTDDAVVPEIWAFEIANSIFVSFSKRKRISEQQIHYYLRLLKALPIRVHSQSMVENIDLKSLARSRGLAAYDAAYLQLASRMKLPLATSDAPLRAAAIAEGVDVIPSSDFSVDAP